MKICSIRAYAKIVLKVDMPFKDILLCYLLVSNLFVHHDPLVKFRYSLVNVRSFVPVFCSAF